MVERTPRIVRTLCAACDQPVKHWAKSHKHYGHVRQGDCKIAKVTDIKMSTVVWRD